LKPRPGGGARDDRNASEAPRSARRPILGVDIQPEHLYKSVGLLFLFLVFYRYFAELSRVLLVVYASAIVAVALNEFVRLVPIQRRLISGILGLVIFAGLGLTLWFSVPALAEQMRGLSGEVPRFQEQLDRISGWLRERTGLNVNLFGPGAGSALSDFLGGPDVLGTAQGVAEWIYLPIVILVGGLFAVAGPNERLLTPLLHVVPRDRRDDFRRLFELLGERLKGWVKGTLLAMIGVGLLTTLGLWAIGVRYSLLLGVTSGLLEVVPFVGPAVSGVFAVSVAVLDDPNRAIWVVFLMLAVQQIEGNLITPLVMAKAAKIHPFVTLFALLLFGSLFGFLGILLAVPLTILVWTTVEVLWVDRAIQAEGDYIEPLVEE